MEIVFATGNKGKLEEVQKIFEDKNIKILSLEDIGFNKDIVEDANTFEGNAFIKAETIYKQYQLPVMADDSGLAVDILNGQPGVYSARYAGENATYADNNKKLLSELKGLCEPYSAKFICCAVFVNKDERIAVSGELPGKIVNEFKGQNGFGYDPIFQPDGFNITLAEMTLEEKNKISHRAKAFNLLKEKIFV